MSDAPNPVSREGIEPSKHELAEQQRATILRVVRITFLVAFFTVAILLILDLDSAGPGQRELFGGLAVAIEWRIIIVASLVIAAAAAAVDVLTPRRRINTLFTLLFGLIGALLLMVALGYIIDLVATTYDIDRPDLIAALKVLIGIALAYLGVTTVLQTQDDFRLVIPYVEFAKQIRGPRPLLLDTSALIDARIVDLGQTGILQAPVVIPRFVIAELQLLADSSDKLQRGKGRRGLEVIERLQRVALLDVSIDDTPMPGKAVDQMLVEMARTMPGIIVTGDLALARIAAIHGVRSLNLNEVATALKPALVPGELVELTLVRPGEQPGQAVGYLDDGTMVVAENGAEKIGERASLTITSTLQTSAGRLLFARIAEHDRPPLLDASAAPHADDVRHEHAEPSEGPAPASDPGSIPPTIVPPPAPIKPGPFPVKPPNPRPNRFRNPRR